MAERTTVRLPEELMRQAKRLATAQNRTLTSLIEDGLRIILAEAQRARKAKRVLPRVSKATGGLRPGVDLTSFSAIQEMDDLESVARMKHFE
jgi:hypothetical protein